VGSQAVGSHGFSWDGRDNLGNKVSLGIYFYQLQAGNETHVKKMLFGVGSMNASAPILQSGPSQTIELKKEKKAWSYNATAGTFTVQIENLNCTTTPQIATRQFDNIAVQSDTSLNFVVAPAAAQPPSPVYPAPYGSPVWHPDGRIAFNWTKIIKINRCTGGVSVGDIDWDSTGFWIINGDRTGLQKLLPYGLTSPAWSYDGQWIAFGAVQIYKMKFTGTQFDTTTVVQLTTKGRNFFPAWSPNGQWIAYDSDVNDPRGANVIWKMFSDGSGKKDISRHEVGEWRMPNWSPDGRMIVHQRYVGLDAPEIVTMDTSGSGEVRLTYNDRFDSYPKYSPDGTKIAFTSQVNGDIPQLWVMNSDGTNQQQLTTQGANMFFSWSPDGTRLVYVQHDYRKANPNNGTLWMMNADGSNKRQLTFNYGLVFVP
jgi:TolB protein